jgi:hypothetical protein
MHENVFPNKILGLELTSLSPPIHKSISATFLFYLFYILLLIIINKKIN